MSKLEKFEYIKLFWKYIDEVTPVLIFYEVDLKNERYATRMIEVFIDKSVKQVIETGFDFITEAPIPIVDEINQEQEFWSEIISKKEFEEVYTSKYYEGCIDFSR